MDFLIRLAHCHFSFRQPELESLATLLEVDLEWVYYSDKSPYCIVKLPDEATARALVARSILAKDVYELWGQGSVYEELHADVRKRTASRWPDYEHRTFSFVVDSFLGKRSSGKKIEIIQSFAYTGFKGPIRMKDPQEKFWVMEEYEEDLSHRTVNLDQPHEPRMIFMGRYLGKSTRDAILKYDLKKRKYISTTSMEAELSLVTANMALAAPGKLFYDPFVGTGSFMVTAAHFGALSMGSDIDPGAFVARKRRTGFVEAFTSDLTNTPLRNVQFLDGIVCDPPYGVREGLRVLGTRSGKAIEPVIIDGVPAHYRPGYIPPKKPYGFEAMQRDVLGFAARSLVTNGRLAMWMPTAMDEMDLPLPVHPNLELISVSTQSFHNWARMLLTYRRLPEGEVSDTALARNKADDEGASADDLNEFRRSTSGGIAQRDSNAKGKEPKEN
ncbi:S-adenosyl-L-methionine-dependent methyltransferase [Penicillium chermesinum]|nr:S-adenosyl-L-methionine-dependent methyltransferase [Penicillium chermesinum]